MASAVKQATTSSTPDKRVTLWTLTDADPTGDYLELPAGPDRSVQIIFSAGTGTVAIEGTNEPTPTTTSTLHNAVDGTSLSTTIPLFAQVLEVSLKIRPTLTGGSGATVLVYLCSN